MGTIPGIKGPSSTRTPWCRCGRVVSRDGYPPQGRPRHACWGGFRPRPQWPRIEAGTLVSLAACTALRPPPSCKRNKHDG